MAALDPGPGPPSIFLEQYPRKSVGERGEDLKMPTILLQASQEAAVVPVRNELLAALPEYELEALKAHLRRAELPPGKILHGAGEVADQVYFLDSGAASLIVEMRTGEAIETALVGRDGAVGGAPALQNRPTLNKAFMQI